MNTKRQLAIYPLSLFLFLTVSSAFADPITVERLTWAGVKFVSGDTTVFVDAVGTDLWDGNAPEGLVPVTADTGRRYALITHAHNDHFDIETLKEVLGDRGYVICHENIATYIASRGLRVIPAASWEPISRGGFTFTAVPAVDGFGDEQVSWIISVDGRRFFHGGDTLWHGQWRTIGSQFAPIDIAFLPVNGVRVGGEPAQETPAVLTPNQAVDAAIALNAQLLVPIHYGLDDPPGYDEVDNALDKTETEASRRSLSFRHLEPGEQIEIAD